MIHRLMAPIKNALLNPARTHQWFPKSLWLVKECLFGLSLEYRLNDHFKTRGQHRARGSTIAAPSPLNKLSKFDTAFRLLGLLNKFEIQLRCTMFTSNLYLSYRGWIGQSCASDHLGNLSSSSCNHCPGLGTHRSRLASSPWGLHPQPESAQPSVQEWPEKNIELVASRTFPDLYYLISEWKCYTILFLGIRFFLRSDIKLL